jgi:probable phosphoglycerate mutase
MVALPTIVFLRHGETDWNVEGRLQGSRDIPLNDKGRGQARRNGEAVGGAIPDVAGFDFVASPLIRARETMEIARRTMGLDPHAYRTDDRLREIVYGEWEGLTGSELEATVPDLIVARQKDKWRFLPPGGESYHLLCERVGEWLATIDRPTFVVSHGGVARVVRKILLDLDPSEVMTGDIPQDRVLIFGSTGGEWI